ncbi:ankyrin repeat and SAM domain-containing protein 4B [Hemicordylus capensis]|uniref:ankyrin repeat and SAM domain-containing protein 4B n=1 Tax=Hemicordylus capensis TaxID=884348 RepID=UPI002303C3D7|nr:ankyrin repeat and SAM domain-containing protein 4B [Hemicordylus capensis]
MKPKQGGCCCGGGGPSRRRPREALPPSCGREGASPPRSSSPPIFGAASCHPASQSARGDPDKCDIWGNTPLHHAASNGHLNCVSFLINFGANVFALDNDMRSPLDAAASRNQYECVRILDNAATEQTLKNPKRASKLKAQAERNVERQIRECERRQEKHELQMNRNYSKESMNSVRGTATRTKISNFFTSSSLGTLPKHLKDTFRLRTKKREEGPDDPEAGNNGQESMPVGRTAVMEVFNENDEEELTNDFKRKNSLSEEDDQLGPKSIFNRPGLGNIVFRNKLSTGINAALLSPEKEDASFKIASELFQIKLAEAAGNPDLETDPEESWIEQDIGWDDGKVETTPLEVFLASQNLSELLPILMRENIDLEALMLCSDEDLRSIQMQLGPRKKILHAVDRRKQALSRPGKTGDTQL